MEKVKTYDFTTGKQVDMDIFWYVVNKYLKKSKTPQDIMYAYNRFAKERDLPTLRRKDVEKLLK